MTEERDQDVRRGVGSEVHARVWETLLVFLLARARGKRGSRGS